MQSPRFIYIHGNGTEHWSFAWAKWLKDELDKRGFDTFFETMPDSVIARAEYWLPFLENHVGVGENDVLVGWSSGAVAAMRYAETHKIAGSVLVSPCYTDLGDDLEKQSGYYNAPWQWDAIRANQQKIALVYGDDDPFIPQAEFEYIAGAIRPEVYKTHGGGHFIDQQTFPELLAYIDKTYTA
jgi:predicted alpha/beta hydrolase family esterase